MTGVKSDDKHQPQGTATETGRDSDLELAGASSQEDAVIPPKYYSKFSVYSMMVFAGLALGSDG